jgi:hypothetical protein
MCRSHPAWRLELGKTEKELGEGERGRSFRFRTEGNVQCFVLGREMHSSMITAGKDSANPTSQWLLWETYP